MDSETPKIDTYFGEFDANKYDAICRMLYGAMGRGRRPREGIVGVYFHINDKTTVILSHPGDEIRADVVRHGLFTPREVLDAMNVGGLAIERKPQGHALDLSDCAQEGLAHVVQQ